MRPITLLLIAVLLFPTLSPAQQQTSATTDVQQEISTLRGEVAEQRKQIEELRRALDQLTKNTSAAPAPITAAAPPANALTATSAATTPETAKPAEKNAALAQAERFRLGGDVRIRFDAIRQDRLQDRNRTLLRVRLGAEGKLGEDFIGGAYLATGTLSDNPTGTNQIMSEYFSRRAIGLDRGWITYAPMNAKWIELTGGKFAYTWNRTSMTFDPDLNPEGFSERLNFKTNNAVVKSVSFTGLQLLFNEVATPAVNTYAANDSFAAGGQVSTTLALGKRVSTTVSGVALNWQGTNSIAQAMSSKVLRGNMNTNATVGTGNDVRFRSKFLYVDMVADTTIKTSSERWPVRLILDIATNPRAYSDQNGAISTDVSLGSIQNVHDYQFGYSFSRIEQDAVIAAFNESEYRAPTNVLQHRAYFQWKLQSNTTAVVTGWFGHTLDTRLPNAALAPGILPGQEDPYQKRIQLDLVYKF